MVALGWGAAAAVGDKLDLGVGAENRQAFTRGGFLMIGMIWQFVLAMIIILREEGDLRWSTIRRRSPEEVTIDEEAHRRALDSSA